MLQKLDSNRATVKYLLANSRAFRFGQIAHARLKSFLDSQENPDDWPKFSVSTLISQGEMEFFEKWMEKDIDLLYKQTQSIGAQLVLLNYWVGITSWVDNSFIQYSKQNPVCFVDVRHFGRGVLGIPTNFKYFLAKCGHPNETGYGRIADMVYGELKARVLILEKNQTREMAMASKKESRMEDPKILQ